jgi:predicted anti-sigma-YlaC factor YlaD
MNKKNFCCLEMEEQINLYIDNLLIEEKRKKIEEHLKDCKECNNSYNDYINMNKTLKKDNENYNKYTLDEKVSKQIMFKIRNLKHLEKDINQKIDDADLDYINAAGNNFFDIDGNFNK